MIAAICLAVMPLYFNASGAGQAETDAGVELESRISGRSPNFMDTFDVSTRATRRPISIGTRSRFMA